MIGKTYLAAGMDVRSVSSAFWNALQDEDGHLPDLDQGGCGEVTGGHLRVRFAHDLEHGELLACEVLDTRTAEVWEAAFAKSATATGSTAYTYWSGAKPGEPRPWCVAVKGMQLSEWQPRLQPRFISISHAYLAPGGVALAENLVARASMDDEISYLRDESRSQARVIERMRVERSERWHHRTDVFQNETASLPAPAKREWRLREIDEWAELNRGRIVILSRALAAARKSEYSEPNLVFAALEVLASTYPAVKKGFAHRNSIKEELDRLNMEIGGSVGPSVAGTAGSEYEFSWKGRKRFLDQHIKRGVTRDPRYSMRIYFTWDEELQLVLVGFLPGHLSNSRS